MKASEQATWLADCDIGVRQKVRRTVRELYKDPATVRIDTYTPHDPEHFRRVEKLIQELVPRTRWNALTDDERLILSCCAWTHDIGMNRRTHPEAGVSDKELRKNHVEVGAAWVLEHLAAVLGRGGAQVIAYIIRFHSRANDLKDCVDELIFRGRPIRARLLAAYLRLGDALEADQQRVQRTDPAKFALLTKLTFADKDETLFHWVKSYALGGVRIDHDRGRLELEFRVPKECIKDSGFRFLQNYVRNEILDELESVESILEGGKISSFHSVQDRVVSLSFTGHHAQDWKRILDTVLHSLRVEYSPNSTEMTRAALLMVQDLEGIIDPDQHVDRTRDVVNTLDRQLKRRPCHHELSLIFEQVKQEASRHEERRNLSPFRQNFEDLLSRQKEEIAKQFWELFRGSAELRLLLYGCSESVADALSRHPSDLQLLTLLIAEGRSKSQHGAHNVPRYVDGVTYAELLREKLNPGQPVGPADSVADGTHENRPEKLQTELHVIPDIAAAAALGSGPDKRAVDAVVLGANGIYPGKVNGIAHSLGHLSVALIAKELKIPVLVVASAAKIWPKDSTPSPEKVEHRRGWFTKDQRLLERLKDLHCSVDWNPREEVVEFSHITHLISEFGKVDGEDEGLTEKLIEWRKKILQKLGIEERPQSAAAGGRT